MTTLATAVNDDHDDDDLLRVALWCAQLVVAFAFCFFGLFKLTAPFAEVASEFSWPGEFPPLFTRMLGLLDIVGGIGILLPALTRVLPRLTVLAALGAFGLQICAIAFHASRGEFAVLPLNALLLPLAAFVWWGRSRRAVVSALPPAAARRRVLVVLLWAAQLAVAIVFCGAGVFKATAPIASVVAGLPFAGDFPTWFVRTIGIVDLAGGVGILLPSLTRVLPRTTVVAAIGCIALQVLAIGLHVGRSEWSVLPLNALLLTSAIFVAWGRARAAVVEPLPRDAARRRVLTVTLWVAQGVVALVFIGAGLFKMSAPIPVLAAAMKWPGDLPAALVRLIGAIDLAGGLGIVLPALTRIRPRLTVLAALGCSVLQVLAIVFHTVRGEYAMLPLNLVLLPLALYALWGRAGKARVVARC